MSRGALVVIEGIDRCGKTSQTLKLVDSLRKKKIPAERVAFPDRTTLTGQLISQYLNNKECKLNDHAIHLLFTANRWENAENMKELLEEGVTLIVDRYSYSGVAFSTAKGMNLQWCMQPEVGLPKPDLVVFLSIKPETQTQRPGFGAERYETSVLQEKVATIFHEFARTEENWEVLDANNTFEVVHTALFSKVEKTVKDVTEHNPPLQYLTGDVGTERPHDLHTVKTAKKL